jgi:SAM-dependent MidA family methyltransferase
VLLDGLVLLCHITAHYHIFFNFCTQPFEIDSCTGQIYEIGGGSGTCAKGVLDYMMLNAPPKVYNNMKYM